jgi:hypothetical protein
LQEVGQQQQLQKTTNSEAEAADAETNLWLYWLGDM